MKKSHIALAIAALVPALAQAQSNVTMYGVAEPTVDVGYKLTSATSTATTTGGVTVVTAGAQSSYKPAFRVQDGNSQGVGTSRWGVRGNEDLGGGMKANFQFEMGIRIDDGCATVAGTPACSSGNSGGNLFGRNAWAGVSGGFGEIRMGRQLLGAFVVQANSLVDGAASGLYSTGSVTPLMGGVRYSNAIKYITPNLGGLTATLTLGAPEGVSQTTAGTTVTSTGAKTGIDLAVEYSSGPLYLGFGIDRTGGSSSTVAAGAVTAAGTNSVKGMTLGGSFNLGVVQPFFHVARAKTDTAS